MAERYQVAIVGSGPAGLSAGARAAARGMSHIVLERQPVYADTIQKYQRGKFVMATPDFLDLRSDIWFQASYRETILDTWGKQAREAGMNIRYNAEVTKIAGRKGAFTLTLKDGSMLEAEQVVLAIGTQGNINKLRAPGAELPFVQYQLDDPKEFADEDIIVIGASDSAIENAIALAEQNRVVIVNRGSEFPRAKTGNRNAILKAIQNKRVECAYDAETAKVEPGRIFLKSTKGEAGTREYRCDRVIARIGSEPPRKFMEACGIAIPKGSSTGYPEVSETYETNVPGLYVIGALAGYPLIKHCMNQGYDVIETISGHPIAPVDEKLLEEKLLGLPGRPAVSESLALIKQRVGLFSGLTTLQLREFLLDSDTHLLRAGEVLQASEDYAETMLCVVEGTIEIDLPEDRITGTPARTILRSTGEFFGEVGIVAGRRRPTRVRARTDCVLIELARRSAVKLINSVPAAKKLFNEATIIRQMQDDLSPELTAADLEPILRTAEIKSFKKGAVLMREGEADNAIFLIRSGSVSVTRRMADETVNLDFEAAGDLLNKTMIVRGTPQSKPTSTKTMTATIDTEAIRIDADAFRTLLDRRPDLRAKIEREVQEGLLIGVQRERDFMRGEMAEFLYKEGIGEATDVLLIDEALCIRCDNCEKACAESHDGISRLNREAGPTFAMLHVPTSCRHCEHPHCMADCPPDAIHRAGKGEVWIDNTCIGCGNCVENCPYGVIKLASPPPPKPGLLSWLLLGAGPGPGEPKGYDKKSKKPDSSPGKVKLAVKCDMCKGIEGGAACVRACPTGAAIRVSPKEFFDSLGRRA